MTSPTGQQRRPPSGAGFLLLFVVLAGVFGMHALATHGVPGNHMAGMSHHDASAEHPAVSASPSLQAPAGDFSSAMSLCLAVLVASVLLLLVRRARGLDLLGLAQRWLAVGQPSTIRGRDRDPPSLTLLSLRRC